MRRARRALAVVAVAILASSCGDGNPSGPSRADVARGATSGFDGTWEGTFTIASCRGSGSAEDITCRRRFPPSRSVLMRLTLTEDGSTVRGRLALGSLTGSVTGSTSSGELTLNGTVRDEVLTLTLTSWKTTRRGDTMSGEFAFRSRPRVHPGSATATATIRVLGRTN